jgi:hypothetical protein
VIPEDPSGNNVDANPGYGLPGLREFSQLLNRWFVLRDRAVTFHAAIRCGERHAVTRFRIWVTLLAFHVEGHMQFVTEWNGLFRRRFNSWRNCIFRRSFLRGGRSHWGYKRDIQNYEKQASQRDQARLAFLLEQRAGREFPADAGFFCRGSHF